jgi:hypothetical protein
MPKKTKTRKATGGAGRARPAARRAPGAKADRRFTIAVTPGEYERFDKICRSLGVAASGQARSILISWVDEVEARSAGEKGANERRQYDRLVKGAVKGEKVVVEE